MTFALVLVFCTAIAGASPPTVEACPARNALLFRTNAPPNWPHDVGHVLSLTVLTPAVYGFSLEAGSSRWQARLMAAGTAVAAMVLKEWYDHRAVGNFSGRDIAFGVVGTGAGFYVAERINWSPRARPEKNQR